MSYTLEQQLSILRDEILRDKSTAIEGDADSLWTDESMVRAIKNAEFDYARRTLAFVSNKEELELEVGESEYELPAHIIAVAAVRKADKTQLVRVGASLTGPSEDRTHESYEEQLMLLSDGAPTSYSTDEASLVDLDVAVRLNLYPAPDAANVQTLTLKTITVPSYDYSLDNVGRFSIIPETHQFDVLCGAASYLLMTDDRDAGDFTRVKVFADRFEARIRDVSKNRTMAMSLGAQFDFGASVFK